MSRHTHTHTHTHTQHNTSTQSPATQDQLLCENRSADTHTYIHTYTTPGRTRHRHRLAPPISMPATPLHTSLVLGTQRPVASNVSSSTVTVAAVATRRSRDAHTAMKSIFRWERREGIGKSVSRRVCSQYVCVIMCVGISSPECRVGCERFDRLPNRCAP